MPRILLLDTDRQMAATAGKFFKQAGYDLDHYTDPQSAVAAADTKQPDIIILDLFLATRSGIEFLYELRSYPEWQSIPVIITGRLGADELAVFSNSFKELNIAKYLSRQTSSLHNLLTEVEKTLQPAAA